MSTSTTTVRAGSDAEHTKDELIDADGHVIEDMRGILERLEGPYRELREQTLHGGAGEPANLFPPLGFLNNMPYVTTAMLDRKPAEHGLDPASWEYFLDAVGIERTVLYPTLATTIGRARDLEYSIALSRAYNDWMADTYVRHPSGKFQAAALLPMQVPSEAVAELRRAVGELGFCSAVIPSHGLPNHLGSEQFFPVYQAAQELDVPLAFHGDGHDGMGFDDLNVYAPIHALGHPISLLITLGGMLFNGVFELFPGLRVAYLEGGSAWILMAAERFTESFKALQPVQSKRVLKLETGTSVLDYLRRLMAQGRIVLGCEGGERYLATAIKDFGCQPFMYSSDFPHEVSVASCQHELEELNDLEIDEESKRLLRGGTARTFYRL